MTRGMTHVSIRSGVVRQSQTKVANLSKLLRLSAMSLVHKSFCRSPKLFKAFGRRLYRERLRQGTPKQILTEWIEEVEGCLRVIKVRQLFWKSFKQSAESRKFGS